MDRGSDPVAELDHAGEADGVVRRHLREYIPLKKELRGGLVRLLFGT